MTCELHQEARQLLKKHVNDPEAVGSMSDDEIRDWYLAFSEWIAVEFWPAIKDLAESYGRSRRA